MRILCTGNPDKLTIAWAVKQRWPEANVISLSVGVDLTTNQGLTTFKQQIVNHDVFVNSSYIAAGLQEKLMHLAVNEWMQADIKGHIFNLGSTIEWTSDIENTYVRSKISLRNASLEVNDRTGITGVKSTYILVGGVDNQHPENREYVRPSSIVDAIEWIYKNPNRIGLIQIDKEK